MSDLLHTLEQLIEKLTAEPREPQQQLEILFDVIQEPLEINRMHFRFTPPLQSESADTNALLHDTFAIIGTETTDPPHLLAADLSQADLPVCVIAGIPEESEDIEVLNQVADSLSAFIKTMYAVARADSIPLWKTPCRSDHEHQLYIAMSETLGFDLRRTWWASHMVEGPLDYYWQQYLLPPLPEPYKEHILKTIDRDEVIFSLFSILTWKVEKGIKYLAIAEEAPLLPYLIDLLATADSDSRIEQLHSAIANCRSTAIPWLVHIVKQYPSQKVREQCLTILKDLEYPEIPQLPAAPDSEPVICHQLEWPPFDEQDFIRIKHITMLIIFLAVFISAGIFFLISGKWLPMILGAAAFGVSTIFLPDIGSHLLIRKLHGSDYGERIIDEDTFKQLIESGEAARCIEYAGKESAEPLGYLLYKSADLENGESRPLLFFCNTDLYSDQVFDWYEKGAIPQDGLRSEAVLAYWETFTPN